MLRPAKGTLERYSMGRPDSSMKLASKWTGPTVKTSSIHAGHRTVTNFPSVFGVVTSFLPWGFPWASVESVGSHSYDPYSLHPLSLSVLHGFAWRYRPSYSGDTKSRMRDRGAASLPFLVAGRFRRMLGNLYRSRIAGHAIHVGSPPLLT